MEETPAYGLWLLVIINSLIFIVFALSFSRPRITRDWRSFGAYSAFIVALFTEMYGFPLTIYLLSGWLVSRNPEIDLLSHDAGHLWQTLLGLGGDPHFQLASYSQLCAHRRRAHFDYIGLGSALPGPNNSHCGRGGPVRLGSSPAIPGICADHAWVFAPVAYADHSFHVPCIGDHVCPAGPKGRTRSDG